MINSFIIRSLKEFFEIQYEFKKRADRPNSARDRADAGHRMQQRCDDAPEPRHSGNKAENADYAERAQHGERFARRRERDG